MQTSAKVLGTELHSTYISHTLRTLLEMVWQFSYQHKWRKFQKKTYNLGAFSFPISVTQVNAASHHKTSLMQTCHPSHTLASNV